MIMMRKSKIIFYQLMIVCLALFFYVDILSGQKSLINLYDSYDQSFMWMSKVFEAARNLELVLWDFTTQSGVSFVGELQTAPFYLPALLLAFMPMDFLSYFHFFIFAHTLLSAIGFFVLLKRYGLYTSVAAISSVLFAFSMGIIGRSVGQVNIYASLAWMPLIVLGFDYIFTSKSKKYFALGVAILSTSASMAFYAGHTHPLVISATVGLLLSIARNRLVADNVLASNSRTWVHRPLALLISFILFIVFSMPQLIATFEYMYLTYKWYGPGHTIFPHTVPVSEITNNAIKYEDLKSLFWPTGLSVPGAPMYLGTGCWLTAGLSILINALRLSNHSAGQALRFQAVVVLATVVLISFAFGLAYYNVPVLSNVRIPGRWGFGVVFLLCLLYAISLDSIIRALRDRSCTFLPCPNLARNINSISPINRLCRNLISGAVLFLSMWYIAQISQDNIDRIEKNSYENNAAIDAEKTPHFRKLKELMSEVNKNGNGWRFYAPRELIPPNIGNKYDFMYSAHGFRSSRTVLYHEYFDFQPLGEKVRSLSVKYWVAKGDNELLSGLEPIFVSDDDIRIYELLNVYPILRRSDYVMASNQDNLLKDANIKFRSNSVTFNFNSTVSGEFVFSSTWYPGFYVTTEHEKVEVANKNSLMLFTLTKPTKSLTIRYQPIYYGYISYIYAIIAMVIVTIFYKFDRH